MTLASEISRLQTAKANIETAIEWKWVTVPDDAKLDTYHLYINQIIWWGSLSGVKLYNNQVTGYDAAPRCWSPMSFEEDWKLYWCCAAVQEKWTSNDAQACFYSFRKVWSWDISYYYNSSSSYNWYYSPNRIENSKYYTNWTTILCYCFIRYYPTTWSNYIMCYKATRDYKNSNSTSQPTRVGTSTSWSFNPEDYWQDLTWYTQIIWSSWVASAVWNEIDDDWYIYLVLK